MDVFILPISPWLWAYDCYDHLPLFYEYCFILDCRFYYHGKRVLFVIFHLFIFVFFFFFFKIFYCRYNQEYIKSNYEPISTIDPDSSSSSSSSSLFDKNGYDEIFPSQRDQYQNHEENSLLSSPFYYGSSSSYDPQQQTKTNNNNNSSSSSSFQSNQPHSNHIKDSIRSFQQTTSDLWRNFYKHKLFLENILLL